VTFLPSPAEPERKSAGEVKNFLHAKMSSAGVSGLRRGDYNEITIAPKQKKYDVEVVLCKKKVGLAMTSQTALFLCRPHTFARGMPISHVSSGSKIRDNR
jgi:hypothetical protein